MGYDSIHNAKKAGKEIERLLEGLNRIFIIGCGTCVTLTRTGGEPEVRAMKEELSAKGKDGHRSNGGSGCLR